MSGRRVREILEDPPSDVFRPCTRIGDVFVYDNDCLEALAKELVGEYPPENQTDDDTGTEPALRDLI